MMPRRRIIPIIRVWWNSLKSIPENEFDPSLDMDSEYIADILTQIDYLKKKFAGYTHNLCKRRDVAHRNDMERAP